jgi:hypothetical protein
MNQGIILYFSVAVVTHFSIVLGMAILLTVSHSIYCSVKRETNNHATGTVFSMQIKYLLVIIALSIGIGSLSLIVSPAAADILFRTALLLDIIGPTLVLGKALYQLKAGETAQESQMLSDSLQTPVNGSGRNLPRN